MSGMSGVIPCLLSILYLRCQARQKAVLVAEDEEILSILYLRCYYGEGGPVPGGVTFPPSFNSLFEMHIDAFCEPWTRPKSTFQFSI